jgi:predicted metal-binding membrane protein
MNLLAVASFAASWTVMVLAMMLPTALPFIARFASEQHSCGRQAWPRWQHPLWTVLLLIAGYVGVWLVFGLIAALAYRGLHELQQFIGHAIGAHASPNLMVQATLVIAGLYQFTPAKRHSIGGACSWGHRLAGRWPGDAPGISPLLLGARYGWRCLGGCWALMLLMFAGGGHNLALMLGLGAIMAAEKNAVWAGRLSRLLGIVLLVIALVWVCWAGAQGVARSVLAAEAITAHNTLDAPERVRPVAFDVATVQGDHPAVRLPAKSVVALESLS